MSRAPRCRIGVERRGAGGSVLTQTSATLNATVNPNGGAVSACRFEYGSTSSYGSSVPCASLPGSGSSAVAVSARLQGLSANTTYHFRIVASNAGGTGTGADQALTTLANAPSVTTDAATALTQTSATLNATVNPNGGTVSACRFEYGSTSAYGTSVPCASLPGAGSGAVAVSANVEGLAANTTYHFRIVASNAGGTAFGADQSFTTVSSAPSVVTVTASSLTQTAATLNASVNPNGGAVSDCHFEYGTSVFYEASVPCAALPGAGSSPVAVSAEVEGLAPNATYHFRIVADNEGGTSSGADQTLSTLPNPPKVETGAASALASTAATLNASVNPNGGSVSDCHFEYGTSVFYEASVPCASLPGSGSSAVAVFSLVQGLIPSASYHFRIVASNAGGTGTGEDQAFTTLPPVPTITLVSPNAGPLGGGTTVAITGTELSAATSVRFGSAAATFTVTSPTTITAVSPAGTGTVDVTVTTPSGTSSTSSSDQFSYIPAPTVTGLSPAAGPVGGGTTVTISGTNFSGATAVRFGSTSAASFVVKSATSISAVSPAETAGTVGVTVTTVGGTSLISSIATYKFRPTITSVSPTGGPKAGGTSVTISGTGFISIAGYTTLFFGTLKATSVVCSSSTKCTAVSPAHEIGTVNVKAIVNKVESATSTADKFTYS